MWLLVPMSGMRGRRMHFRLYTALDRMAKDKAGDCTRIAYLHGSLITRQTPSSPYLHVARPYWDLPWQHVQFSRLFNVSWLCCAPLIGTDVQLLVNHCMGDLQKLTPEGHLSTHSPQNAA